jgi:nitroimidazol reductase NimA-like FMN-containing flavoprotein (pyridoxamine 5'-phosphate oxidase superfamily)
MDDTGQSEDLRRREAQDLSRVRRRDRAVEDDQWIRSFLEGAPACVVATESDGWPFATPLIFAYDAESHCVYFHTGRAGRLFSNVARNPRMCLSAFTMGKLAAATKASGFDVEYESVTAFGSVRVLDDAEEAVRGLRLLLDKYFPELRYGQDYGAIASKELARTAVYRLDIDSWSGKRNPPA